ncbi:Protein of unknown function [Halobacillus dabanensis]|uniref:DUF4179 domain-containing protein n=1 Tax=Halobacillus dabanensis TaxID=240302 RepID=A0A1I3YJL4_HALDA|nr:DUF4179 domain-containing protein [Halobacillus dabanensis]SFK32032.1 Protein of unknown function [Halobacillus dabanensis]
MSERWDYPEEIKNLKFNKENQNNVINRLKEPVRVKKKKFRKRWAAAACIFLFIGGLMFTPAMEHVVAKIPYISQFLDQKEDRMERLDAFYEDISLSLKKEGYQMENIQVSWDDKEVIIEMKSMNNDDFAVQLLVEEELEDKGFNDYSVSVKPFKERNTKTDVTEEEIEEYQKNTEELETKLTKRLEKNSFELMFPVQVQMNPTQGVYINVIVPETEKRLDLLEEIMLEEGKEYGEDPDLDIRQVQKRAREQEIRWGKTGAINDIAQAMMESEQFPVTGFSYSFHPYPLQIKIKTSLGQSSRRSKEIAEEIKSEIDLFIQSGEKTKSIREDRYEVHVLSKDKNKIE